MFSFEWALTHRSFPRILPDSSFSRRYSQILFEVWCKNELSSVICPSPRSFKLFSLLIQPLYSSLFRSVSTIHGGVSRHHSRVCEDRRRVSLKSWFVLLKIHSSSLCHPPIIVFRLWKFFSYPSGAFDELFSFLDHPKAIISEDFFVLSFPNSFSNYSISVPLRSSQYSPGASFKYSSISSRSLRSFASKSPLAYLFF